MDLSRAGPTGWTRRAGASSMAQPCARPVRSDLMKPDSGGAAAPVRGRAVLLSRSSAARRAALRRVARSADPRRPLLDADPAHRHDRQRRPRIHQAGRHGVLRRRQARCSRRGSASSQPATRGRKTRPRGRGTSSTTFASSGNRRRARRRVQLPSLPHAARLGRGFAGSAGVAIACAAWTASCASRERHIFLEQTLILSRNLSNFF